MKKNFQEILDLFVRFYALLILAFTVGCVSSPDPELKPQALDGFKSEKAESEQTKYPKLDWLGVDPSKEVEKLKEHVLTGKNTSLNKHFRFIPVGAVPPKTMLEISETLQLHGDRIVQKFGITNLPMITVKVWQDRKAFEASFGENSKNVQGYVDTQNWEVRLFNGRPTLGLTAVHEFTHLVTVALNPSIVNKPRWLWESIAIYESNRPPVPEPTKLGCISPSTFPRLDELDTHPSNIYRIGYFITDYILSTWQQEGLKKLIFFNGNTQEALGVSKEKFESDWLKYMLSKYDLQFVKDASKNC